MSDAGEEARLDIPAIQLQLREFASARDWEQFHSPKNLAMALAGEISELVEIFQWLTPAESYELGDDDRASAAEELADIQIYMLRLADILQIALPEAVAAKILVNEARYPIELSRGDATKYSRKRRA